MNRNQEMSAFLVSSETVRTGGSTERRRARRAFRGSLLALVSTALLACAAAPPAPVPPPPTPPASTGPTQPMAAATTPDAPFRAQAPEPGPAPVFVPPKVEEAKLKNGIRVLLVPRHDLPIVALQIVSEHGADQAKPGVAAFTMAGLLLGTKTRSAEQISDALDGLGVAYGTSAGYDGCFLHGQVLSSRFGEALEVLADVWKNPSFPKDELEIERGKRLTWLAQEADSAGAQLSRTMLANLYPERHPYRLPTLGDEASLKAISSNDLATFHRGHLRADHLIISVAGDIEKGPLLEQLEKTFGDWAGKDSPEVAPAKAPKLTGPRIVLVDRPDATQTNLAVALPGTPRKTPDFEALLVMNTILGGQFTSRLNLNLREAHAYTYGARSHFDMRDGAGPFTAGGAMVREKTTEALKEMFAELERIQKTTVSDEELANAKGNLLQQLPARFETAAETAGTFASLALYGLPLDELSTREAKIKAVTKEEVKRVAEAYLRTGEMRVVLVGDAKVIKPGLSSLGLGEPTMVVPPAKPTLKGSSPHAAKAAPGAGKSGSPAAKSKTVAAPKKTK
jgi:zinc protease